jgi:superfamily II RNA helicase
MVKICSEKYSDENDEKYQAHFDIFPYSLSPFQKHAIEAIIEGNHVLVTAHTGSGKTLPAEFAIRHFVGLGKKIIYTSPIKALSNQKYYEFTNKYPDIKFGLFTGDIKTNPEADVLIMTTEILMNYLFMDTGTDTDRDRDGANLSFTINIRDELACVIFDEVHYINDQERGQVWEKTILMLPEHIQMVMLSATIDNPAGFAEWCENRYSGDKTVYLASTNHRVVPLSHYGYVTTTEAIFKIVKDKELQKKIRDQTNTLIDLQSATGSFQEVGYKNILFSQKILQDNRVQINRKHAMNQLSLFLRDREMLPAIAFVFSRKNVELFAKDITVSLLEDDSKVPYIVRREAEQILRKLPNYAEYLQLPEYTRLIGLLEKGVGIHHSGMIPVLREIVELMISKKYIKLLFATESFAIGLDCPIRTVVFTSLTKFDGDGERYLMPHEYTQMAGRAGRRGIDTVGYVVHCNNLFSLPSLGEYKTILGGVPQKLVSKFRISYGLIFNLIKNGKTRDFDAFSKKSMIHGEISKNVEMCVSRLDQFESAIQKKRDSLKMARTCETVCRQYLGLEELLKTSVNKKRKECERNMGSLIDQYKSLKQDVAAVKELADMERNFDREKGVLEYDSNWISSQTDLVCKLLENDGFIEIDETCGGYKMAGLGTIAGQLAEVHPLIMGRRIIDSDYFANFSVKQLIGFFSCFTDVKVAAESRSVVPSSEDPVLNREISNMVDMCNYYEKYELDNGMNTGIRYDEILMFDMIQYSMDWCDCVLEEDCKYFIQNVIVEKGISLGDFTKAMMKIVTISREIEGICEMVGRIDLLYKIRQIEKGVLKYVLTSQSLYL